MAVRSDSVAGSLSSPSSVKPAATGFSDRLAFAPAPVSVPPAAPAGAGVTLPATLPGGTPAGLRPAPSGPAAAGGPAHYRRLAESALEIMRYPLLEGSGQWTGEGLAAILKGAIGDTLSGGPTMDVRRALLALARDLGPRLTATRDWSPKRQTELAGRLAALLQQVDAGTIKPGDVVAGLRPLVTTPANPAARRDTAPVMSTPLPQPPAPLEAVYAPPPRTGDSGNPPLPALRVGASVPATVRPPASLVPDPNARTAPRDAAAAKAAMTPQAAWEQRSQMLHALAERFAALPPSSEGNAASAGLAQLSRDIPAAAALSQAVAAAEAGGRKTVVRGAEVMDLPAAKAELGKRTASVDARLEAVKREIAALETALSPSPAIPSGQKPDIGAPAARPLPQAAMKFSEDVQDLARQNGLSPDDIAALMRRGLSPEQAVNVLNGAKMRARGAAASSPLGSGSQAQGPRDLSQVSAENVETTSVERLANLLAKAGPGEMREARRRDHDLFERILTRLYGAFGEDMRPKPGVSDFEATRILAGLVSVDNVFRRDPGGLTTPPAAAAPQTGPVFTPQRIEGIEQDPRTRFPEVAEAVQRAAAQWPNGTPSPRDLTVLHMQRYISVRTGLPNGDAVPLMMREGDRVAVLSFAGIKNWNDDKAIGHHGADAVIAGFGRMLSRLFPGAVAHVGGDTFALVLRGDHIEGSVERLREFMSRVGAGFTDDAGNRHVIHGWDILTTGIGDDLETARQAMGRQKEEMIASGTYPERGARAPSAAVYPPGDPRASAAGRPIVPMDGLTPLVEQGARQQDDYLYGGPDALVRNRRDVGRYRLRPTAQEVITQAEAMSPAERTRAGLALLAERYFAPGGGGLLNKTAWDELPHDRYTALVDVNALGAINKIMGLEAGDAMLDHVRQAFQRVLERYPGLRVYWLSGDEFGITGGDRGEVEAALREVREDLASQRIEATVGGERIVYKPITFSFGLVENDMSQSRPHPNEVAMDAALQEDKTRQVEQGLRLQAGSTADPPGMRRERVGAGR